MEDEGDGEAGRSDRQESDRGAFNVQDDSTTVPWDNNSDGAFGVALNGKTLAFLIAPENREKYDVVLKKVLHKA